MLDRLLFKKIDNSPLIIFRIFFGILIALECYGAIATGWVQRTLVEPKFTFTFIGFEWLQPLPGYGMYLYFMIMGTLGIFIALGYRYRWSMVGFTILWTAVYLMQKSSYNNHYYLLILVSFLMCFFPANSCYSLDSKRNPSILRDHMYSYVKWGVVLQLFIVYTFASVAKLYGDWLDFSFIKVLMHSKSGYYFIGETLQVAFFQKIIAVFGILFDMLIVPALLWRRTRIVTFLLSITFHLFNSIVFQIGIFPYLALAFTVFFFEPETIRSLFFRNKIPWQQTTVEVPPYKKWLVLLGGIYFLIQLTLPLRHFLIRDDVLWTEEGHRLSWRMMLRGRAGTIQFNIIDKADGSGEIVNPEDYLTTKQLRKVEAYPDFIWQFAQYLKKEYAQKGVDIAVYVKSEVSVNGKPRRPYIDPKVDLANEPWDHFRHHEWILPSK